MAALLAVMGALSAIVPAAAPAAQTNANAGVCSMFLMLRLC